MGHKEALVVYEELSKSFPFSSSLQIRATKSAMLAGKATLAVPYLKQLQENRPNSAETHKVFGTLYFNYSNNKQVAINYFKRALELDPNIPQASRLRNLIAKWQQ